MSDAVDASQAIRSGAPFSDLMGIELVERTKGKVVGRMTVREDLCTSGSILHGGAYMAFADTLGAIGAVMNLAEGQWTTTLESKTNFFRSAPAGSTLTGTSTPLHLGRRSSVWQTRIENDEGKLMALVTQTQMVLDP
jgi:1,4-dihydroxy-2-naphthoyl-CoA hydrolase